MASNNDLLKIIVDAELKKNSSLEKALKNIKEAFSNVEVKAEIDIDGKEFKKLQENFDALQKKIKELEASISKGIGEGIKDSAKEGKKHLEGVSDELKEQIKYVEKINKMGKTTKSTTGDNQGFRKKTITKKSNGDEEEENVYDYKKASKTYLDLFEMSKKWAGVTKEQKEEFREQLSIFKQMSKEELGSKNFLNQMKRVDAEYDKLQEREKAYQVAMKKRESIMGKISKLQKSDSNLLTSDDFKDLDGNLNGNSKNKNTGLVDLKTVKGVESRFKKISKIFDELIDKNKKLNVEMDALGKHENYKDKFFDDKDLEASKKLQKDADDIKKKSDKEQQDSEKKMVSANDKARKKQLDFIKKMNAMKNSDDNLLTDEYKELEQQLKKLEGIDSFDKLEKEVTSVEQAFDKLIKKNAQLNKEMKEMVDHENYKQKFADNKSMEESKALQKQADDIKKQRDAKFKAEENRVVGNMETMNHKNRTSFDQRFNNVKSFVDNDKEDWIKEEEFERVKKIFSNINVEAKDFKTELALAEQELKKLEKHAQGLSNLQDAQNDQRKKMNLDIKKSRNIENAEYMEKRGNVPQKDIDNFKKMSSGLNSEIGEGKILATKKEVEAVAKEWRRLQAVERDAVSEAREQNKVTKELQTATSKWANQIDDIDYSALNKLSRDGYGKVEKSIQDVMEELDKLKSKEDKLSDGEKDAVNRKIKNLKREINHYKELEDAVERLNKEKDTAHKQALVEDRNRKRKQASDEEGIDIKKDRFYENANMMGGRGRVSNVDVDTFKKLVDGLDAKSTKKEIEDVNKAWRSLLETERQAVKFEKELNGRKNKTETVDVKKDRMYEKANDMSGRGNTEYADIEAYKKLVDSLDADSSKTEIEKVERAWRNLVKQEKLVVQAEKERNDMAKRSEKNDKDREKAVDSLTQAMKDLKSSSDLAFNGKNINTRQYEMLEREIEGVENAIKHVESSTGELGEKQKRMIQNQIKEVKRLMAEYKQLEQTERKAYAENDQRDLKKTKRGAKLGNQVDSGFNWDAINPDDITDSQKKIQKEIYDTLEALHASDKGYKKIDKSMIQVKRTTDELGKEIYKVEYQVDRGNRNFEDFTVTLDTANREVRNLGQNMRRMRREMSSLEQLGQAMEKVPIWAMATGVVFGAVEQFKQGFEMILELDKAMTNLSKVAQEGRQEVKNYEADAIDLGKSLGMTADQVVRATTEFARLGYTLDESNALGEQSLVYANVGDMGVEEAHEAIISAVKGFNVEVDASGKSVRKIVDVFNEVGNNYAISSEGIGEALKRSSALLSQAGNSIEQSVALVTAANTTIQDPKKVGTAMKTIAMRLRGVSEEGDKIVGLVPHLREEFDRLGIDMMENEDTFKSTYQLFDDLSKKWGDMTDMEKANLTELIGGKRQGSIVASTIENWGDAMGSYETAMESAGSAQREFSRYQDSFQYRIGRLKGAMEEFWAVFYDDGAVKTAIDSLTGFVEVLTQITEMIGMLPVMGGLLATTLSLSNKSMRDFVIAGRGMSTIGDILGNIKGQAKSLLGLLLRFGGVGLIFTGIGIALEVVVGMFLKASRAKEEHLRTLRDEYEQNEKLLQQYEKFEENGKMTDYSLLTKIPEQDLNLDERRELNSLQEELLGMGVNIVDHYTAEGEAVYKTADAIKELMELKKKEQAEGKVELATAEIESFDFGKNILKDDGIADIVNQIKTLEDTFNHFQLGGVASEDIMIEFFERNKEAIKNGGDELVGLTEGLREKLSESLSEEELNSFFTGMGGSILNEMQSGFGGEEMIDQYDAFLANVREQNIAYTEEMDRLSKELASKTGDLQPHIDALAEGFINENTDLGKNEIALVEDFAKNYALSLGDVESDTEEFRKHILDFGANMEDVFEKMSEMDIDIGAIKTGDTEGEIEAIKKLISEYGRYSEEGRTLTGVLKILEEQLLAEKNANDDLTDSWKLGENAINRLNTEYQNATSDIAFLNGAKEELKENNMLEADTMLDLINRFPQLAQHLGNQADLERELAKVISEKGEIATDVIRQRLENDEKFFNNTLKANQSFYNQLGDMYEINVDNWNSVAQAKAETEQALIRQLGGAWAKYYRIQANGQVGYTDEINKLAEANGGVIDMQMRAIMAKKSQIQAEADKLSKQFDAITATAINVDFNSIGISKPKSSKKKKDKKADEPDYKEWIDAWIKERQLGAERLERQEAEIDNKIKLAKEEENHAEAIRQTNKLMSNYNSRIKELGKSNSVLKNLMGNYNNSWVTEDGEATLKYIDAYNKASKSQQESMEVKFEILSKLKKQYLENSEEIKSLGYAVTDLKKDIDDLNFDKLKAEMDKLNESIDETWDNLMDMKRDLEREFSYLDEGDQAGQVTLFKKRLDLLEQERNLIIENITKLQDQRKKLAGNKELLKENAEEVEKWQEQLKDLNLEVIDTQEEVKDVYEELADTIIGEYKDAIERQKEAEIEAIEEAMEAEKDRHDQRMDNLDDEMDKFEESIKQQLDAIDKQEETDDYERELNKKQQDRQRIITEINKYSMDNTAEGRRKLAQLKEELTTKEEEIEQYMHDRQINLRKDALNQELEAKRQQTEQLKEEDTIYHDEQMAKYESQREAINLHYENLLADERRWNQLRADIMNENFDSITAEMQGFVEDISSSTERIGENISKNLIEKLQETLNLMQKLKDDSLKPDDLVKPKKEDVDKPKPKPKTPEKKKDDKKDDKKSGSGSGSGGSGSGSGSGSGGSGGSSKLSSLPLRKRSGGFAVPRGGWDKNSVVDYIKSKGYYADFSDREKMFKHLGGSGTYRGSNSQNNWLKSQLKAVGFRTGGYTGEWGNSGKMAVLHEKEMVLNKMDTKNILEAVHMIRKLKDFLPVIGRPSISQPKREKEQPTQSGDIHVHFNIDNLHGGEKGAKTLVTKFNDALKKRGVK